MPRKNQNRTTVRVKGFVRAALINIVTGEVQMGEWCPNTITADGFQHYICGPVGALAGSKTVGFLQLATQTTAPSSAQTAASGEFGARKATTNAFVANGTVRATASWNTNEGNGSNVGACAVYNTSSGGTCGSVATFASSAKSTAQVLNISYDYRFL